MEGSKTVRRAAIALFWLAVWQLLSLLVHNRVLLSGPIDTLVALVELLPTGVFWRSVLLTTLRVTLGFSAGAGMGLLLASLSYRFGLFEELVSPLISVVKAVPVASFVILLLISFGSGRVSFFVSLLVVLPILYYNTLKGLRATDEKLLEAASVYRMGLVERVRGIYFPQLYPYLLSAVELAVGMAFKSGIAAEVIGQPLSSLGNDLYRAKIYLETEKVLAVTLTAVALSFVVGRIFTALLRELGRRGGAYETDLP